jgi:hypothetical protein
MSQKPAEGAVRKKSGRFLGLTWGTWVALALVIPIGVMTFNLYRGWSALRAERNQQVGHHNVLVERNKVLGKVFDNLQNKQFQICNKTADTVTVNWLAAAYHDGRQIRYFDSSRCRDWKAPVLVPGDARFPTLNSDQENCNWTNGDVVYYAMQYTRESEDAVNTINFVGHFKGYDRDCHNVQ